MEDHDTDSRGAGGRPPGRFGLLGVIGPESTIACRRLILGEYRRRRPDGSAPPLLINSIDIAWMLALVGAADPALSRA
jgi:aspartate/glutamate racemase